MAPSAHPLLTVIVRTSISAYGTALDCNSTSTLTLWAFIPDITCRTLPDVSITTRSTVPSYDLWSADIVSKPRALTMLLNIPLSSWVKNVVENMNFRSPTQTQTPIWAECDGLIDADMCAFGTESVDSKRNERASGQCDLRSPRPLEG